MVILVLTKPKAIWLGHEIPGIGNITGKEIGYTVNGNIINFQISGDVSNQALEQFQKLLSTPTQLDSSSLSSGEKMDRAEHQAKSEESSEVSQQFKQVLKEVEKIEGSVKLTKKL